MKMANPPNKPMIKNPQEISTGLPPAKRVFTKNKDAIKNMNSNFICIFRYLIIISNSFFLRLRITS
jgi:hypothetical protein